ncbi:MAG: RHS repeat-associated core domain-containing protein [Ktedonobacteraceae bacterium]
MGRLTAVIKPGDSSSSPSVAYTYTNTCTFGSTTPCLEVDTATRTTVGGPTTTMQQWYDGDGHLVETRSPSPYSGSDLITYNIYDNMGQLTTASLTYSVPTSTSYVAPDQTKARAVTSYDASGRPLGKVTYSDQNNGTYIVLSTSYSYTVAQGVTGLSSESSNAYEQTVTLDAYNHQSISYTDALGRTRYTQAFSGTNPYSVVRTVGTSYDVLGDATTVQTSDHTATVKATYSATFDALKRRTGFNDSDMGSCSNTPLPAGCSSSSDQAWKFSYDADGNMINQSDPRNQSVYASYDVLDRPLCRGTTSAAVNPCSNSAYARYFYDSYGNTSNPGVTFPSGCTAPSGSYASDPIGRTTAESFSGNNSAGTGWRCYGYDQRGQTDQSTLSVTADGNTTTQTMNMLYNDAGEITRLVYPDGETLTSTYDNDGRFRTAYFGTPSTPDPVNFLVGQTNYTGFDMIYSMAMGGSGPKGSPPTTPIFTTTFGYDGIYRPLTRDATRNNVTFWNLSLTYDNVSNVLGATTTVPTASSGTLTQSEAFCYDALNRLIWADNTGTPTGGDHCMNAPSGTTLPTYQQTYGYDDLDRITSGEKGTVSYSDGNHVHAATTLGSVPNPYASYNAMGNMTCRNINTTTAHTCASGSANGATMTYDAEGRMDSWTAPSGTTASDKFLYDNEGKRVLQRTSTTTGGTTTVTDDITFDGFTEVTISGGTTATAKYYSADGQRVAMRVNGTLSYLLSDILGSSTIALNSDGSGQAVQLFSPYGSVNYSWGSMPTTYNFTGQRLDSQTGLLYYNFRYYDSVSGRFVRADTMEVNERGMDPYAYVGGNPETKNDPTGHCPLCFYILGGAAAGALTSAGQYIVTSVVNGTPITDKGVTHALISGAIVGALVGPGLANSVTMWLGPVVDKYIVSDHFDGFLNDYFKNHNIFTAPTGTAHAPGPKPIKNIPLSFPAHGKTSPKSTPITIPRQNNSMRMPYNRVGALAARATWHSAVSSMASLTSARAWAAPSYLATRLMALNRG